MFHIIRLKNILLYYAYLKFKATLLSQLNIKLKTDKQTAKRCDNFNTNIKFNIIS